MSPVFSKYQREIKVGDRLDTFLTSDALDSKCYERNGSRKKDLDVHKKSQHQVKNKIANICNTKDHSSESPIESGFVLDTVQNYQENGCILEDVDISSKIEPKEIPEEIWDKDTLDDLFEPCASPNAKQNLYWYIKDKEELLKECIEACPEGILKSDTFFHPASSNMQPSFYQLVAFKKYFSSGPELPIEDGQFDDV